ncbi:lipopolysaccharide biosynthesis protein [Mucilaginibacter litoreus]|uniref:Lipopolysaccharide biosynthesis protein n=1 Tax=Mucilaginibacter litoreus TaxID=1048221 RepID=A0ABW3AVY5_9SPHI
MEDTSKKTVAKGILWNAIQLIINTAFTLGIRLVLAKLLLPKEFGIVGMAVVFTGFVQILNDLGISAALVQKKEELLTDAHYYTAFWTGVSFSIVLYSIVCFALGPLVAMFYHEPVLTKLIPVISLGILASPVNLIHKTQLTKRMDFKRIAIIDNTSNIIAGCLSLGLAFLGAGVWALVFNSVANIVIAMPLYFATTRWKPKFIWDNKAFKEIFGFGIYATFTNIIGYLMNNVDYLLIGRLLGPGALGIYTFAFTLTDAFRGRLLQVVNNVMYPLYGKIQSDSSALKRYYLKVVNYNSIVINPIMLLLLVIGEPIVINLFGAKWSGSVYPLKILALSVMMHLLVNSNTALIRGMGRAALEMNLQIFKSLIYIPTLIVGIYYNGIIGAAWAVLLNKIFAVILAQYTFNRLLKIEFGTMEFLNAVKYSWVASFAAFIVGYYLFQNQHVNYILVGLLMMLIYCLTIYLMMKDLIISEFKELKVAKNK